MAKTWVNRLAVVGMLLLSAGYNQVVAAAESSEELRKQYEAWVRAYRQTPPADGFVSRNHVASRELLTITVIEGDDLPVQKEQIEPLGNNYRIVTYGCSVSTKGRVSYFQYDSGGFKGSGYPILPKQNLKQVKLLAANLLDDHSQLPPPGRRLIIQAATSGKTSVRVYDRANMPDAVLQIIRLAGASIQPWTIHFPPEKVASAAELSAAGIPVPSYDRVSPDGSLKVAQGYHNVVVGSPTQPAIRELQEPEINRHIDSLFGAVFTPGGRYLLLQSSRPAIRIYDTKTWEPVDGLPGLPADAVAYYPDTDWKRAVFASSKGDMGLWNSSTQRELRNFGIGEILDVAFSPDHSLVAVAWQAKNNDTDGALRVQVWRTDSGSLAAELQPSEQIEQIGVARYAKVSGMLGWWPDSEYLLTIVRPHGFFTDRNIAIWNAQSGRYRGDLSGCNTWIDRFIVSAENGRVFAECYGGGLIIWDAGARIKQIAEFERSLVPGAASPGY
jgi:WD40 repeat protein